MTIMNDNLVLLMENSKSIGMTSMATSPRVLVGDYYIGRTRMALFFIVVCAVLFNANCFLTVSTVVICFHLQKNNFVWHLFCVEE